MLRSHHAHKKGLTKIIIQEKNRHGKSIFVGIEVDLLIFKQGVALGHHLPLQPGSRLYQLMAEVRTSVLSPGRFADLFCGAFGAPF